MQVHIKQAIITAAQYKMIKLLALFVIVVKKEFQWMASANAKKDDMMINPMSNAYNVIILGNTLTY